MNEMLYSIAQRFEGMQEISGEKDHPFIVWAHSLCGLPDTPDEVPWCSSWLNAIAFLAGAERSNSARARSWLRVGKGIPLKDAVPGDIVVLQRGKGEQPGPDVYDAPGHVGFYAGVTGELIEVLGGNQSDTVKISRYPKTRLLGVRRLK